MGNTTVIYSKQKWHKYGNIFCPSGNIDWMYSHASVPVAEHIEKDIFKIYFSTRDRNNCSYLGYIVIDINQPSKILELSNSPVLSPGALGTFDDSGVMLSWITKIKNTSYLYYIGWNIGVTVPFRNAIGLATKDGNNECSRYSIGPILDRSLHDPYFCASCCVLEDNGIWMMWYLSCTQWKMVNGKPRHFYHIKYAESYDAIHWDRKGIVAIDYKNSLEYAISRPSVIRDDKIFKMWYSTRGDFYRIGYAESNNGLDWHRLDHFAGIDVSPFGWDSEMIEYPFVFDHKGTRYMLYNGNGYGKTGFGLAILT